MWMKREQKLRPVVVRACICVCVVLNKKKPIIAVAESICRLARGV